jgi:hypothetical protein
MRILAVGPFESITMRHCTAELLVEAIEGWGSLHTALDRKHFQSIKLIYIMAFGAEAEVEVVLVFDKKRGVRKYDM